MVTTPKRLTCVVYAIIFTFPIAICGSMPVVAYQVNNWRLNNYANSLYDYTLPPQTKVIQRSAKVDLMGNGNHCDFQVIQEMETTLSKSEIERYYETVKFPPVFDSETIFYTQSLNFKQQQAEEDEIRFSVVLFSMDYQSFASWLDFRCG